MENKQKALEMVATMQQKEESGSLLWCVAEDLKNTIMDTETNLPTAKS